MIASAQMPSSKSAVVLLDKTLESPLDWKEIQPVNPKINQFWIFIGRTDAEAEAPILWPPDVKSWLIRKDPDSGKDWRQEEKGMTEDEMVGWHHWPKGHGFGWTPAVGDGQGGLASCGSWGHKESDMTEQLNWAELIHISRPFEPPSYLSSRPTPLDWYRAPVCVSWAIEQIPIGHLFYIW